MAIARAFTKNTGAPIANTQQVGTIAYTAPGAIINFAATGLTWYNGPEEGESITNPLNPAGLTDDVAGYVVCVEGVTSVPGSGITSPIKFYRSNGFTENAFMALCSSITGLTYSNGNDAAAALQQAGHFSNWTLQNNVSYTPITTRVSSPCSSTEIYLYGSDGRYYVGEGVEFNGYLYFPASQSGSSFNWTELIISNGIVQEGNVITSSCGWGPGEELPV